MDDMENTGTTDQRSSSRAQNYGASEAGSGGGAGGESGSGASSRGQAGTRL
jgi:hypothetical protein